MNDYIKQLEQQNEELQQKLARASVWIPVWVKLPSTTPRQWELTNGYFNHARIIENKPNVFAGTILSRDRITFIYETLEETQHRCEYELEKVRVNRIIPNIDWNP